MEKFRLLVPNIIRSIAGLVAFASVIVVFTDFFHAAAWGIFLGGLCSSVLIFGFASLVQAAEYYISCFRPEPEENEEIEN